MTAELNFIMGLILLVIAGIFVWQSHILIAERKHRYRAGTHDYYDNPINPDAQDREPE